MLNNEKIKFKLRLIFDKFEEIFKDLYRNKKQYSEKNIKKIFLYYFTYIHHHPNY